MMTDLTGALQLQLAYQVALVRPDNPGAITTVGTPVTTTTPYCYGASVAAATSTVMWIRFGVAYNLSTGSNLGAADVTLILTDDRCGQTVGSATHSLHTTSTTDTYVPLTAWLPAVMAAKVKAAFISTALQGPFRFRLAMRTANTAVGQPNAWSTTFDTWRSTATEDCTGDLPTNITGAMYVQFGIQFALSSGSFANCIVSATVTIRD